MITPLDTIVRTRVDLGLKAVRLPLSTFELVARRGQDNSQWRPAIAFEALEASVKGAVADLTGDRTLASVSQLQRHEVEAREEALVAEAKAEATAERARAEAKAERERIAERERAAAQRAAALARASEAQTARREREAEERARKRKEASEKATAAREDLLHKEETVAKAQTLEQEQAALQAKRQAVAAKAAEQRLERQVRAKKAARKAG